MWVLLAVAAVLIWLQRPVFPTIYAVQLGAGYLLLATLTYFSCKWLAHRLRTEFDSVEALTLLRVDRPVPAVVLITGSGPQDRDESVAGHKPFLVLADYLTRRGVAVLRTRAKIAWQYFPL